MTAAMPPFVLRLNASRVRFGAGALAALPDEVRALGCSRALVLSTPNQAEEARRAADLLGSLAAGTYTRAAMHTPVEVTEDALGEVARTGADCTVAIGGGSTTGLGKAIGWRIGLPQVAVATTYAGSEVTPILGQTEGGRKTTFSDPRVQPQVVIYDPDLTLDLPQDMTMTSALNAMAVFSAWSSLSSVPPSPSRAITEYLTPDSCITCRTSCIRTIDNCLPILFNTASDPLSSP